MTTLIGNDTGIEATTGDAWTRRHFLGTGSVMAVGVLIGAVVTATPLGAEEPRADVTAKVAAILNRPLAAVGWNEQYERCECAHCEGIRQRRFACESCGFAGVPLVFPCECAEQWEEYVYINAHMLRAPEIKGEQWMKLAAFQRRLRRAGRPGLCPPWDRNCAHTSTKCPVCGDCGDGDPFGYPEDSAAVARMLKDVRSLLATLGN